jgi:SHS2 domain-containing protein
MPPNGYEECDHTADLALRVWGEGFTNLLNQSVQGMYHLMGVDLQDGPSVETQFDVASGPPEAQLVDFLSELLYLCEDENKAFHNFTFADADGAFRVRASGHLVKSLERIIKAVTFHDLAIDEQDGILSTTIVFDV